MSSKNINLTCRVECSPICSITWYKDNRQIDVNTNPLYYTKTNVLPPDLQKNDFESIQSTLVINISLNDCVFQLNFFFYYITDMEYDRVAW